MTYLRVLGAIGLIGATVLGATSQLQAPQPAQASAAFAALSPNAAVTAARNALRTGQFVTKNGTIIHLSSALVNSSNAGRSAGTSKATASVTRTSSASPAPQPTGGTRANQDWGYFQTGNGTLFHNTESVAVDPNSALHLVVSATDTRLGSDGNYFNVSSNPTVNGTCFIGGAPVSCFLIQALGGPGIYNSVDAAKTWTDQIIPDMITGSVPDALQPTNVEAVATTAAITCYTAAGGLLPPVPGTSQACLPYDSVGDQSVAFDATGNLYVASLGLITNIPAGVITNFGGGTPQTDVVINVSQAIQPLTGPTFSLQPNSAGRFFNAPPTTAACNPSLASTTICLHNEVSASNTSSNFLSPAAAAAVGRNFPADNGTHTGPNVGGGRLGCGIAAFCVIDQPYLAIDNGIDPIAYLTYTVYDFSNGTSNIYLQVSKVGNAPGTLPAWSAPISIDNPNATVYATAGTNGNFYCATPGGSYATTAPFGVCNASWGAEPTIGPDGLAYIVYENANTPISDAGTVYGTTPLLHSILVATVSSGATYGSTTVLSTALAGLAEDHDQAYLAANAGNCNPLAPPVGGTPFSCATAASLDTGANAAYFTIPNRPTIAVTGATVNGNVNYGSGEVIVAWTDARSLVGGTVSTAFGTRVWYALGLPKARCAASSGCIQPQAVHFGLLGTGSLGVSVPTTAPDVIGGTYNIAEVQEPGVLSYQFFPWLTASQGVFNGLPDNIFIGYYQYLPSNAASALLQYRVGKSNDFGSTFGVNPVATNMPLPQVPLSAATCTSFGFASQAVCNATPYFGTYTGIASNGPIGDIVNPNNTNGGNGAYAAFTDTRPNTRNFNQGGSQDVTVVQLN